jgi:hypothetical protein
MIPPQRIADALVQMNERLNRRPVETGGTGLQVEFGETGSTTSDFGPAVGQGQMQTNATIERVARLVGLVIVLVLGVGFLAFLVRPLFSRDRSILRFDLRRFFRFKEFAIWIVRRARSIVAWFRSRPRAMRRTMTTVVDQVREVQSRRREAIRQRSRRRERERMIATNLYVRGMVRVARWGTRIGLVYTRTEGGSRYLGRVEERFPVEHEAIQTLREIYERAVYSSHDITEQDQQRFNRCLQTVIRLRG